ncbi:MAG TPA: hypothetical protein VGH93_09000, partial [Solirubrobacteraceae bacterium]
MRVPRRVRVPRRQRRRAAGRSPSVIRENLFTAERDASQAIEGFTWRAARVGDRVGGELIGG